eukprot:SAG31_NODE_578_length_13949_cov_5.041372_4_plen_57_part_00
MSDSVGRDDMPWCTKQQLTCANLPLNALPDKILNAMLGQIVVQSEEFLWSTTVALY